MDRERGGNDKTDDSPARDERPIPPERWIIVEPWAYDGMREDACTYVPPDREEDTSLGEGSLSDTGCRKRAE